MWSAMTRNRLEPLQASAGRTHNGSTVNLSGRKHQALVSNYHILPPTTAILDYAIGLEKLPANGHFFVGDQMAVRLEEDAGKRCSECGFTLLKKWRLHTRGKMPDRAS